MFGTTTDRVHPEIVLVGALGVSTIVERTLAARASVTTWRAPVKIQAHHTLLEDPLENSAIAVLLPVVGEVVTSWPRTGVVLLILIAVALSGVALVTNLRGTAVTAVHEPLDVPALAPPSHEPVIGGEQPAEGDVTSQHHQPYDSATGNPSGGDPSEGEREPFDI